MKKNGRIRDVPWEDVHFWSGSQENVALEIHELTEGYPKDEKYSLTDQMRRSSRSVPANLAEAWKKRRYEKAFISKLIDCAGEAGETEVWLDFSKDFGYVDKEKYNHLMSRYNEINRSYMA